MNTAFRGVFLTSVDPVAAARFYREVAGLPIEEADREDFLAHPERLSCWDDRGRRRRVRCGW